MRGRRTGFVLPAVLGVLVLFAGLIGAVTLLVRAGVDNALLVIDDLETDSLAKAGLELAAYQLILLKAPATGLDGQQIRLDAGTVTLGVTAEGARIDLNGSDPKLLAGAWTVAGRTSLSPEAFAARVVDWRDGDDERGKDGAEAADYAAAKLPWTPQNDAFRSVDELRYVLGVGPADVAALKPLVTVANPAGTIDLYDASPDVLRALPGMTRASVERMVKLRKARSDKTSTLLSALVNADQAMVTTEPPVAFRVRLSVKTNRGASKTVTAVIAVDGTGRTPYRVVEFHEGA